MKNSRSKWVTLAVLVSVAVMGCKSDTEEKKENLEQATEDVTTAKEEVEVAKEELTAARMDSINTYVKYRAEVDARLAENDKQIAEIRANIKTQKAAIRTKMNQDLDVLMKKNEDFKIEMKKQKDGAYSSWERFKQDFNSNLDNLGKSISEMAENNRKK